MKRTLFIAGLLVAGLSGTATAEQSYYGGPPPGYGYNSPPPGYGPPEPDRSSKKPFGGFPNPMNMFSGNKGHDNDHYGPSPGYGDYPPPGAYPGYSQSYPPLLPQEGMSGMSVNYPPPPLPPPPPPPPPPQEGLGGNYLPPPPWNNQNGSGSYPPAGAYPYPPQGGWDRPR